MNIRPSHIFVSIAIAAGLLAGCVSQESAPPVKVVDAAPPTATYDKPLPMPGNSADLAPGFDDPALLHQQLPEEPNFIAAYERVGKPRLMVFVNRTLTGDLIPVNPNTPLITIQNTQQANGTVHANSNTSTTDNSLYSTYTQNNNRSFESNGPAQYTSKTDVYLQPGQYDEAQARSIDYELIENLISDNLSADGKVTLISPHSARQRLTDEEVKELQSGRPQMLGELSEKLQADVLIQVTARPSAQTDQGLGIRLIAESFNTKGGQSVANAAVDVPPPLTKTRLNVYTRFVARKLMDGMTQSWNNMVQQSPAPTATSQTANAFPPGVQGKSTTLPTTLPNEYDGIKETAK